MPAPKYAAYDQNGLPLAAGLLEVFEAGTSTPATTYSDVELTIPNTNPIVLDPGGRASVYLAPGFFKFVQRTSVALGATIVWTQDNVASTASVGSDTELNMPGVAGEAIFAGAVCYLSTGSGGKIQGRWYLADGDFAYASSTALIIAIAAKAAAADTGCVFNLQGHSVVPGPMTVGVVQYVSNTPGQLSATPGTNSRIVGIADTPTTIVTVSSFPDAPTAGSDLALTGNLSVGGTSTLTGATSIGSTLNVTGAVTLASTLNSGAVSCTDLMATGAIGTIGMVNSAGVTTTALTASTITASVSISTPAALTAGTCVVSGNGQFNSLNVAATGTFLDLISPTLYAPSTTFTLAVAGPLNILTMTASNVLTLGFLQQQLNVLPGAIIFTGGARDVTISSNSFGISDVVRYGSTLIIGNNTAGSTAPGVLALVSKDSVHYHLWVDSAGKLRISSSKPSALTGDTGGVVVGTQT